MLAGSPYSVTVTDANGCTASTTVTVTQPASALTASAVGETVACNNNMGDITLTVSGGTPVYTYDWDYNGLQSPDTDPQNPSGLNGGTYTVTVTDANGCTTTAQATITVTPPFFSPPPNDGSTVPCIADAQVLPTPPTITDNCGGAIYITGPVIGADPSCSGTKVYTYTYTDSVTSISAFWTYTYTISPPTFVMPANGSSTVACIANATPPVPPTVNNNCGSPLTITGPVIGANPVCSGTKTYTYTYTDCTNNTADWVYTYTVSPPTISAPAPGSANVACIANAQVVPVPPSVSNSCGALASVTGPVVSADPVCSGPKTYTWTYTDCTNATVQYVFTYNVSPPTFTLPGNGASTVPCISDAQTVPTPPSVVNSCGNPITPTGPVVSPDPACSGTKTYTWTYMDCDNTTLQWVFTYTISPPTISAPAPGSATVACISDAQTVPTPPSVNNSCGTPATVTGPVVGVDPACSGTKTYTWTYTDCTNNTVQYVFTYTISPPTFSVPAAGGSAVPCLINAQVVPTPPTVMNSCGATITPTGPVAGPDPMCAGTKTYTWTYLDCSGISMQWVYTYTIPAPSLTLPSDGGSTVACISDAQVVPTPPNVNDSCGNPVTPTGPVASADPACSGTKTYTYTYTDCTGNNLLWVYTYTITPPTFTPPAAGGSTVACISDAQAAPVPPPTNNSCGTPLTITGPVVGPDPVCSGTKTYTYTYMDCTGSTSPWIYTYTISPPSISAPAPGSATVACISDAQVVPTPPTVNNSCGDPASITGPVIGPDPVCSGTKTYTWTYTDCTNNTVDYVFTYTINPATASLPAPGASTVACISDAQVVPTPPNVNDTCGNPVTPTGPVVGPDPVCSGTKTYTWNYVDCSGASLDWVYTYTISPPTISAPAPGSLTVACIADAQVVPTPPSVNNSCGAPASVTGPVVGADPACSGTKTYTWTYTDCTNNTVQYVYTYTINPPMFSLPAPGGSVAPCIADAQVVPTPPTVMNSCGATITPTGPVISPDPSCGGTKTYTWTYTDCTGTAMDWVYTYTINPTTFTLPADAGSTVACISDAQVTPTPPIVINACGSPVTPTGPVASADPLCSGTKTYTWTYTDCSGNDLLWIYTYTISAPTFTPPAAGGSTVACISDAQTPPVPPATNNSCGTPLTITGPVVGPDPVCSGTKTYTYTYMDCTGSTSPWVYTYTISPPSISAPAPGSATVACISDAQVVPVPPVVNNSCGDPASMTGPVIGPDPVCSGTKTYTWTYTDCTNNTVDYVFTYTINPATASLPAPGASTVACISDAQTVPTPPNVNDTCGNPVTPTGPVVGPDPVCSGTKTYTWTYVDCSGASLDWVYTYTISPPTISAPAPGSLTVACISDAQVVPTPPSVNNSCGAPASVTGPVVGADPACSGTKTYTWTYTDCTNNTVQYVYTYTINPPMFSLPAAGGSVAPCIADAQVVPTPPTVMNSCGATITPTGPVISPDPSCGGTKTYTWTYTDCTGTAMDWVYTYTINPTTFTLPADAGSTVACISDAQVTPTPPIVINACGSPVTPTGPVASADPLCSGTKTYTWTYTDCSGNDLLWIYTYTISAPTFTPPAAGGSTVACISDAQTPPVPPATNNSCGTPLTITGPVVGPDPVCSGTKTYTYTYMDCTGSTSPWVYTYTISPPSISAPAPGSATVACISDAQVVPVPPVVNNSCGDPASLSGPVIGPDPVCSGTKTYTWTYTDCTNNTVDYVFTYTINPATASLPAPGASTVACISDAQVVPTPPNVNDTCGNPVTPTGPVVGPDPVCSGTKTYTWTYVDCSGASLDWVYTYTISPPTISAPAPGSLTVACISRCTSGSYTTFCE